jgi:hypothetical protein
MHPDRRSADMTTTSTTTRRGPWTLERALFAMAGSVTLAGVALGVLVSPWFLALSVMTGVSQWLFVVAGDCPASWLMRRLTGLRSCDR